MLVNVLYFQTGVVLVCHLLVNLGVVIE
jgi:hypothetical protein